MAAVEVNVLAIDKLNNLLNTKGNRRGLVAARDARRADVAYPVLKMTSNKEREVILAIIENYKNMPFLWQRSHKHYKTKGIKEEGFRALLKIYKEFDKDATLNTLKNKIVNLRTTFAREYRKVIESHQSGSDNIYVPSLYYFDALHFLGDYIRVPPTGTLEIEIASSHCSSDEDNDHQHTASTSGQKKIRLAEPFEVPIEKRNDMFPVVPQLKDDTWVAIGKAIGLQLRDMDTSQRLVAHKLINDVMYYAESGLLSPHCSISLGHPMGQRFNPYEAADSKDHHLHDPLFP